MTLGTWELDDQLGNCHVIILYTEHSTRDQIPFYI